MCGLRRRHRPVAASHSTSPRHSTEQRCPLSHRAWSWPRPGWTRMRPTPTPSTLTHCSSPSPAASRSSTTSRSNCPQVPAACCAAPTARVRDFWRRPTPKLCSQLPSAAPRAPRQRVCTQPPRGTDVAELVPPLVLPVGWLGIWSSTLVCERDGGPSLHGRRNSRGLWAGHQLSTAGAANWMRMFYTPHSPVSLITHDKRA